MVLLKWRAFIEAIRSEGESSHIPITSQQWIIIEVFFYVCVCYKSSIFHEPIKNLAKCMRKTGKKSA